MEGRMSGQGQLAGKVALVTGAGRQRGIGRQIALALAREGADLVLNGSGSHPSTWPPEEQASGWKGLESVAEEVRALGGRAHIAVADLRDSAAVDGMIAKAVSVLGRLDILVNNAAAPRGADRTEVTKLSDELWLDVLGVKLNGAFYCSRAAARQMIAQGQGGRIINISSVAGKRGNPATSAYAIANTGVQMLGAVMARELGQHGITANSLCVGVTDTARIDDMGRGEAFQKLIRRIVPLNRPADPAEIAGVVAFLCRDEGGYITGQSINVDGGIVVH
jgi:3-oxoacyl-[acyl-carrier protein] reductase/meso-butanediol dehydrogenase/(S,S)-butanediol dehydrogenase/diacetyl reductase